MAVTSKYCARNSRTLRIMTNAVTSTSTRARFLLALLVVSAVFPVPSSACGPGRGAHRQRGLRRLTPLVFKQHVPNVSENTLGASGLSEGKITRDDPRFQELVPNYNTDIIFKDEEGTGADRLMTQRCKERLNTLAISVMNQWPGVKLRITEGWDEEGLHAPNSLHYEGRAVDITTSDRDRSKYGMLARLAVEAGFDWVYYESRAHIHASVKSESSQAGRPGGCFPPDSLVLTENGRKNISDVNPGDKILAMDSDGSLSYSEVLLLLDKNRTEERQFVILGTERGKQITVTPSHLIFTMSSEELEEDMDLENSISENSENSDLFRQVNVTAIRLKNRWTATFAHKIQIGDWILVANSNGSVEIQRVTRVGVTVKRGVYAPLTSAGTIVVDDVVASCYAVIDNQDIAHWAFAPVRLFRNIASGTRHFWVSLSRSLRWWSAAEDRSVPVSHSENVSSQTSGIHWYAEALYRIARVLLPNHLVYN